jgi:TatD DNase family protein
VIDTHCHLDAARFDEDRDAVLTRAWDAGLTGILVPGVAPDEWEPLLALARGEKRLKVGLGIHPQALAEWDASEDDAALEKLDALLSLGEAVAVGECGLDGPTLAAAPIDRQLRVLEAHFQLARKHRLPLLLHCFHTHPALVALLEREALPERGGVMHSYSGGAELAKVYGRHELYFGFAGPVTFTEARKPLDAVRAVALDRLLVETDAPDQAPHPFRGQRSEPAYLPRMVAALARVRGVEEAQMARITTENARRLFGPEVG